jgi:hypothetical protein
MNDYDMKIHSNPDAQAWAKFFIQTKEKASWQIEDIDESLMLGWFANAMMAMHDSQRTWVGLTDEEFHEACWESYVDPVTGECSTGDREYAVRWTEAKLKEKNT